MNRLIIGPYEETEYTKKKDLYSKAALENTEGSSTEGSSIEESRDIRKKCKQSKFSILLKSFETYKYLINILKARSRHASCPHPSSCAHYILTVRITISAKYNDLSFSLFYIYRIDSIENIILHILPSHLQGSARAFGYGIGGQLALKLILQFKKLLRDPKLIKTTVFRRENLNLAVFLGGCSGLFRVYYFVALRNIL